MKTSAFIIGLFFLFLINADGQVTFQKTYYLAYDSYGTSVAKTNDGGFIIAGSTVGIGPDIFIVRTDATGNNLWIKSYTMILGGNESAQAIQQTNDGGFIITGEVLYGFSRAFVFMKIDGNGNILWSKYLLPPAYFGYDFGYSVRQTSDAGYIVAGSTGFYGAGLADVYLAKTDSAGNLQWSKTYGGSGLDIGYCVQQTTDGGYIIAGNSNSFGTLNSVYLVKTDAMGDTLWTEIINEAGSGSLFNESYSISQTNDEGYILSGISKLNNVYVVKTTASGAVQWAKTIGAGNENKGSSVIETSDGNFIIAGYTKNTGIDSSDAYLVKMDSNGNLLWSKTYGGTGNDIVSDVEQTADGGYILTGAYSNFPSLERHVFAIKTDSLGYSGCNENNPLSVMTSVASIVSHPPTVISSGSDTSDIPFIVMTGGLEQTLCSMGMDETNTNENSFLLFPNPAGNEIIVRNSDRTAGQSVEIYNLLGNKVYSSQGNQNQEYITVGISGLQPGVYFIKLKGMQERSAKFAKQ